MTSLLVLYIITQNNANNVFSASFVLCVLKTETADDGMLLNVGENFLLHPSLKKYDIDFWASWGSLDVSWGAWSSETEHMWRKNSALAKKLKSTKSTSEKSNI